MSVCVFEQLLLIMISCNPWIEQNISLVLVAFN